MRNDTSATKRSKAMRLRLERTALKKTYTIGHLYDVTNGKRVYICDTIEDKVRDLNHNGVFDNGEVKIPSETAIPYGTYEVTMWVKSPKFSNFTKYPYAKKYKGYLPRLLRVPHFEGILIHSGNDATHSAGCILVGENKVAGKVINSMETLKRLVRLLNSAEDITITIE